MKHDNAELSASLRGCARPGRANSPTLRWPNAGIALHHSDPVQRADGCERFGEDLLRHVADTRRRLRETDRWIANEERREAEAERKAAEQREARARIVALVG